MAEAAPSPVPGDGKGSGGDTETRATVQSVKEGLDNLLHLKAAHKERLERVEEELTKLRKYKTDYEHLTKRLKTLPDKTKHEVMVPFGSLAFMPGHLVHTNEVLVLLGDNWFAERSTKQAREIVTRRIRDCDEKISSAEATRNIHAGWLKEAEEVLSGEAGDQVEITERLTEEEFQRSQEEHKRKVTKHFQQQKEAKKLQKEDGGSDSGGGGGVSDSGGGGVSDSGGGLARDVFVDKLGDRDKRTYDDIMKRLDQLELEEEREDLEDENSESEGDEEEVETEEEEDQEGAASHDPGPSKRTEGGEEVGKLGGGEGEGEMEEDANTQDATSKTRLPLKAKPKLRRRVSWADDARPLYTIIPDDKNEHIYRIKYCTGPLSLSLDLDGGEGWSKAEEVKEEEVKEEKVTNDDESCEVKSPSDIYKVFGAPTSEPQPRGILKKAISLPLDDETAGEVLGWCCPPKSIDVEDDSPEDPAPPPPSPPPRRTHSLTPAFSYRVLEHKGTTEESSSSAPSSSPSASPPSQPKKISKFKAARMRK